MNPFGEFPSHQFDEFEERPFFELLDGMDADEIRSLIPAALIRAAELDDVPESTQVMGMFWGYVSSELERYEMTGDPSALRNVEIALSPISGGATLQGVQKFNLDDMAEGEGPAPNLPDFL